MRSSDGSIRASQIATNNDDCLRRLILFRKQRVVSAAWMSQSCCRHAHSSRVQIDKGSINFNYGVFGLMDRDDKERWDESSYFLCVFVWERLSSVSRTSSNLG
jgi:hypothetical protein